MHVYFNDKELIFADKMMKKIMICIYDCAPASINVNSLIIKYLIRKNILFWLK